MNFLLVQANAVTFEEIFCFVRAEQLRCTTSGTCQMQAFFAPGVWSWSWHWGNLDQDNPSESLQSLGFNKYCGSSIVCAWLPVVWWLGRIVLEDLARTSWCCCEADGNLLSGPYLSLIQVPR
jgi:hypothetical protein